MDANASLTVGDGRSGRYELLGRLAVGGMAELFLARPIDAPHGPAPPVVVLKRILPHLAEDPEFVRMFHDEANLAAKLVHPNIVQVRDIGRDGTHSFFTMEYVHGENLRAILKAVQQRGERIPLEHVLAISLGVTAALHHAHEQVDEAGQPLRIVHRDVSPTNVLVARDGAIKLVDFGIAKAAAATHITQAGMLKGKASYMSPEQCRADPVDRRSDVYSMGILLYEMSTLTRLFKGDNELVILNQVLTGQVTPPSQRVEGYPAELERIVLRALAQKPNDRYQTALEMHDDLARFAAGHGIVSRADALASWIHGVFGPKPLPWVTASSRAPHASDSGLGTQVEPLEADQTEATTQRDAKTPAPRGSSPPPRGRANVPRLGRARAPVGERSSNGPRPAAPDRSPATPGRRSPWTGRRPNADPTARPPGAPLPATGARAGARPKALEPAPRLEPARLRANVRVTPAPRPGGATQTADKRSPEPSTGRSLGSKPQAPPLTRPRERISGAHPSASQSRPQPAPARGRPASRSTLPTKSAFEPPFVPESQPPSGVDKTQFAPAPTARPASAPEPTPLTTTQPPVGSTPPTATTQPPTATTQPPTASHAALAAVAASHSGFATVDRTVVSSDDEIAAFRSAAAAAAVSITGNTQPMSPSRYDPMLDDPRRTGRPTLIWLVPVFIVPIAVLLAVWALWFRDRVEADESETSVEADASARSETVPRAEPPMQLEPADDPVLIETPPNAEADNEHDAAEEETAITEDEVDTGTTQTSAIAENDPAPQPASDISPATRRAKKPKPSARTEPVPAPLPGFGHGHVPP